MPVQTTEQVKDLQLLSVNEVINLMKKIDTEKMFGGEIGRAELHLTSLALKKADMELTKY